MPMRASVRVAARRSDTDKDTKGNKGHRGGTADFYHSTKPHAEREVAPTAVSLPWCPLFSPLCPLCIAKRCTVSDAGPETNVGHSKTRFGSAGRIDFRSCDPRRAVEQHAQPAGSTTRRRQGA